MDVAGLGQAAKPHLPSEWIEQTLEQPQSCLGFYLQTAVAACVGESDGLPCYWQGGSSLAVIAAEDRRVLQQHRDRQRHSLNSHV